MQRDADPESGTMSNAEVADRLSSLAQTLTMEKANAYKVGHIAARPPSSVVWARASTNWSATTLTCVSTPVNARRRAKKPTGLMKRTHLCEATPGRPVRYKCAYHGI